MPKRLLGRSRTWPLLATTSYSGPRYLLIVLALAGDSTITRCFFFRAGTASTPCDRWARRSVTAAGEVGEARWTRAAELRLPLNSSRAGQPGARPDRLAW